MPHALRASGSDPASRRTSGAHGRNRARRDCLRRTAIDINFGCPAPTVNRHDGGATLLKFPDRIREIVRAVRDAVPAEFPVSAKLRLGWDAMDPIHLNAERAAEGGAPRGSRFTAARKPRLHASRLLGADRRSSPRAWTFPSSPTAKSGRSTISSAAAIKPAPSITCSGRGALADPSLPHQIARELGIAFELASDENLGSDRSRMGAADPSFRRSNRAVSRTKAAANARVKQWLRFVHCDSRPNGSISPNALKRWRRCSRILGTAWHFAGGSWIKTIPRVFALAGPWCSSIHESLSETQ